MPVLEFALDAAALYRVQVHLNARQGPVSVMLNHNALGSLATLEEQTAGKDFRLPDSSVLRVRILNGHPQAWHNGHPLILASVSETPSLIERTPRVRIGTGVMVFLILNMLAFGGLILWFVGAAIMVMPASRFFLPFLLSAALAIVGLSGLFAVLSLKKWGFYLASGYMLVNVTIAIVYGIIDYRTFIPLVSLTLLYFALRSSGTWYKMR
jgi:hypothetical protein